MMKDGSLMLTAFIRCVRVEAIATEKVIKEKCGFFSKNDLEMGLRLAPEQNVKRILLMG